MKSDLWKIVVRNEIYPIIYSWGVRFLIIFIAPLKLIERNSSKCNFQRRNHYKLSHFVGKLHLKFSPNGALLIYHAAPTLLPLKQLVNLCARTKELHFSNMDNTTRYY